MKLQKRLISILGILGFTLLAGILAFTVSSWIFHIGAKDEPTLQTEPPAEVMDEQEIEFLDSILPTKQGDELNDMLSVDQTEVSPRPSLPRPKPN